MHWIEKFRSEYRHKDGRIGLSRDELAKKVRTRKVGGRYVGCSGNLIFILEHGGITAPGIAAAITTVCGGTAEQWDGIVHEDYHRKWKPGGKTEFAPRFEINVEDRMAVTIVSHGEIKRGKAPKHVEAKPPKSEPAEAKPQKKQKTEPPKSEPAEPKPQKKQKTEPQIREIVQIGTDFEEIGRYAHLAAAAQAAGVSVRIVGERCERKISGNTDEMVRAKCTWRYADEWDPMNAEQRTEDMRAARRRERRNRNEAVHETVPEGSDAYQPVGRTR